MRRKMIQMSGRRKWRRRKTLRSSSSRLWRLCQIDELLPSCQPSQGSMRGFGTLDYLFYDFIQIVLVNFSPNIFGSGRMIVPFWGRTRMETVGNATAVLRLRLEYFVGMHEWWWREHKQIESCGPWLFVMWRRGGWETSWRKWATPHILY